MAENRTRPSYWYSNEGQLHRLFPFIREQSGVVLAVGSDQGLDIFTNSNSQRLVMVDRDRNVNAVMRAVLEVAKNRRWGNPERFFGSFEFGSLAETSHLLGDLELSDRETAIGLFERGIEYYDPAQKVTRSMSYAQYMRLRSERRDNCGSLYAWYASPSSIDRVAEAYKEGKITISNGTLGEQATCDLQEDVAWKGQHIDTLYISSVEEYIVKGGEFPLVQFWRQISELPLGESCKILRTARDLGFPRDIDIGSRKELTALRDDPDTDNLYQHHLSWHYNIETFAHHAWLKTIIPDYSARGWMRVVRDLLKKNLISETGVSNLSLNQSSKVYREIADFADIE